MANGIRSSNSRLPTPSRMLNQSRNSVTLSKSSIPVPRSRAKWVEILTVKFFAVDRYVRQLVANWVCRSIKLENFENFVNKYLFPRVSWLFHSFSWPFRTFFGNFSRSPAPKMSLQTRLVDRYNWQDGCIWTSNEQKKICSLFFLKFFKKVFISFGCLFIFALCWAQYSPNSLLFCDFFIQKYSKICFYFTQNVFFSYKMFVFLREMCLFFFMHNQRVFLFLVDAKIFSHHYLRAICNFFQSNKRNSFYFRFASFIFLQ